MSRKRPHKGRRDQRGRTGVRKPRLTQTGTIRIVRAGVATVETPAGTFPVARGGIHEAMSGDTVQVVLVRRGDGPEQAVVHAVLERATTTFLGVYGVADPLGVVTPLDGRMNHDFFVIPGDDSAGRLGVREGDVVAARILQYPARRSAGVATIDRRLGSSAELDMAIETAIASFGLATEFPKAVLAEADAVRIDVGEALAKGNRRDLRGLCTFTIDPVDARDYDDAVSVSRSADGGYEVGVHIADVSHYVAWGSSIDVEARQRTCSVYLADRVLPMLPERLCNDVCSLVAGEDRLCMSVLMRLDAKGNVLDAEATRSVIRSHARLSYEQADALLTGDLEPERLPVVCGEAAEVAAAIRMLDDVSRLRQKLRTNRGAIDFETREAKVLLDGNGKPTGVSVRERTAATNLIEEAMLMANESVAKLLSEHEVAAAYRVHERPSPDDLAATLPALREMGLARGAEADALVAGEPYALQRVLAAARGTSAEYLVNALLLRAQKRAVYLPHNDGHYALGARAYCHFTSPIRRYPDLIVHRALKALLDGRLDSREQALIGKQLSQLCRSCSDQERVADAASRTTQKVKMAEYFSDHIGERYAGVISGCERFGIFVMLDDSCAEGLLPARALGDEWFLFDEERMTLTGESTGRTWRLGQRIAVEVAATNPAHGQIDFRLPSSR